MSKLKALGLVSLVVATFGLFAAVPARADLVVHISKGAQRMTVVRDGQPIHTWVVSTGRSGYGTPSGVFHPQRMARTWFSPSAVDGRRRWACRIHCGRSTPPTYESVAHREQPSSAAL